jgi:hypothetical protein
MNNSFTLLILSCFISLVVSAQEKKADQNKKSKLLATEAKQLPTKKNKKPELLSIGTATNDTTKKLKTNGSKLSELKSVSESK